MYYMHHRHLFAVCAGTTVLLLSGCGVGGAGGGSSSGDFTDNISILTAQYQVVDLSTGTLQSRTDIPDLTTNPVYHTTQMVFRAVAAGSGQIGSQSGDFGAQNDETLTSVTVSKYFLGVFEVTQQQWVLIAGSSSTPWTSSTVTDVVGSLPADGTQLAAYALSRTAITTALTSYNTGRSFTLDIPTETQWEYACRASTTTIYSWGNEDVSTEAFVANYAIVSETSLGVLGPQALGSRQSNNFGFYDMHGNVWEWTKGNAHGNGILRGGSWRDSMSQARSANRMELDADTGHALAGVRLVLVP